MGFCNLIEECKNNKVEHFIYASSSSVYGGNKNLPFYESDNVDHPISLYAASKKANELMAHTYSHLFKIPSIGLRFFNVYGYNERHKHGMASPVHTFNDQARINGEITLFKEDNTENLFQRDFVSVEEIVSLIFEILLYQMPVVLVYFYY